MTTIHIPLIIRRSQLKAITGISPTMVDKLEAEGKWPRRVRFSQGIVGWHGPEIAEHIDHAVKDARDRTGG